VTTPRIALAAALLLGSAAGCAGKGGEPARALSPEERAAEQVRTAYVSPDLVPAAAYTWTSPVGIVFVLVDVESGIPGVVQARADLWMAGDSAPTLLGRSDVMPSAASIGALAFRDLTGDGFPDLLGYVADSTGASFPIFVVGARGAMAEQLDLAAAGYRLSADPDEAPRVFAGARGPCAIQVWADEPAPDSQPAGWRYLPLLGAGRLGHPLAGPPSCP
jgi:hypothetical protein